MPSDKTSNRDYSQFVGHVDDICGRSRCQQPSALRYCGTSLCDRHWLEECERQERKELAEHPPELEPVAVDAPLSPEPVLPAPEPESTPGPKPPDVPWRWGY